MIVVSVVPGGPRIITGPAGPFGIVGLGIPVTAMTPLGKLPVPPPSRVNVPPLPEISIVRQLLNPCRAAADEVIVAASKERVSFFTKMLIGALEEKVTLCPSVVGASMVLVTGKPLICRVVAKSPSSRKLNDCPDAGTKFTLVGTAWLGRLLKLIPTVFVKPVVCMVAMEPDGKLTVSPVPAGEVT